MELRLPLHLAERYKSPTQRARVVTEAWAEKNLYCAACTSPRLKRAPPNTEATDFTCPHCGSGFQLKSQSRPLGRTVRDAAYEVMRRFITEGRCPNLLALHYDLERQIVRTLILFPRFVISLSAIEVSKPLSSTARRSGWVGCNIALDKLPADAKIPVVLKGIPVPTRTVRERFERLRPLERLRHDSRGWTIDLLQVVRTIGKKEFSLQEVYDYGDDLRRLHPRNRHVDEKIRQQLQRLRNLGFLEFVRPGSYRMLL